MDLPDYLNYILELFRTMREVSGEEIGGGQFLVSVFEIGSVLTVLNHLPFSQTEGSECFFKDFFPVDDRVPTKTDQDLANTEDGSVSDVKSFALAFSSQRYESFLDYEFRIEDSEDRQSLGSQYSHSRVVVGQFGERKMLNHTL